MQKPKIRVGTIDLRTDTDKILETSALEIDYRARVIRAMSVATARPAEVKSREITLNDKAARSVSHATQTARAWRTIISLQKSASIEEF